MTLISNGKTVNYQIHESFENWRYMFAEIILGNPRSINCEGTGICRIFPQRLTKRTNEKSVHVRLDFFSDYTVVLYLKCSELSDSLYQQHFSNQSFIVEAPVKWPIWIRKQLSQETIPEILPGNYPYTKQGDAFIIHLRNPIPLSQKTT
ncbi:MAG: hypothetical protein JNM22_22885 [Saprospiraceae bacterium]|nr:hypothetical protein [Saprospiraceae bacterium]